MSLTQNPEQRREKNEEELRHRARGKSAGTDFEANPGRGKKLSDVAYGYVA